MLKLFIPYIAPVMISTFLSRWLLEGHSKNHRSPHLTQPKGLLVIHTQPASYNIGKLQRLPAYDVLCRASTGRDGAHSLHVRCTRYRTYDVPTLYSYRPSALVVGVKLIHSNITLYTCNIPFKSTFYRPFRQHCFTTYTDWLRVVPCGFCRLTRGQCLFIPTRHLRRCGQRRGVVHVTNVFFMYLLREPGPFETCSTRPRMQCAIAEAG